jgi:hypothetical protein
MAAVSTARRNRWRTAFIRHGANFYERVLGDAVAIEQDVVWAAHVIIKEGEKIESLVDSFNTESGALSGSFDDLAVTDSLTADKIFQRIVTDLVVGVADVVEVNVLGPTVLSDAVSIIDFSLPQYVPYQDPQVTTSLTIPFWINAFAVTDNIIATPVLSPAAKFSVLADSISLNDSVSVSGSKLNSQVLTDSISQINIYDSVKITVTRIVIPPILYSRKLFNAIDISDSVDATFLGIVPRVLSDSIVVNDSRRTINAKKLVSVVADVNGEVNEMIVYKILSEPFSLISFEIPDPEEIKITDAMIVGRASVTDTVADLSVITSFFDQAIATKTEFVQASAEIVIGIEVQ